MAAKLREFRASEREGERVDQVVQRGAAASGFRLPEPGRLPATTTVGGLTYGKHYTSLKGDCHLFNPDRLHKGLDTSA